MLRNTYDTVVRKLGRYCVAGLDLDLLESYLSGRVQKVDVNGTRSPGSVITTSVLQGSNQGPFLFLYYNNDLPSLTECIYIKLLGINAVLYLRQWIGLQLNNLFLSKKKKLCENVRQAVTNIKVKSKKLNNVGTNVFFGKI